MGRVRDLTGRRVLLTGASGGIGKAIARRLHGRGAHLVLSGRRADVLDELVSDLGERAESAAADLADASAVSELVERAGEVDVLVANAGLPASGTLDSFSAEELDRALDVNLRTPMHMTHLLAPAMVKRGSGHFVYVSSLSAKVVAGGGAVYSATKAGLRAFALGVRDDLHGTGVGVTTIFPGFISEAGMWAEAGLKLPPGVGLKSPEQVAAAVLRGIERDKAEIDVAPLGLRASGKLGTVAPAAVAAVMRRAGSSELSKALARAQKSKR